MHVRKGDVVIVIAGNDKGRTGEVRQVDNKKNRVLDEAEPAEPQGRAHPGRALDPRQQRDAARPGDGQGHSQAEAGGLRRW